MRAISTVGTVTEDGTLRIDLQDKIKPGRHNPVLVLEDERADPSTEESLPLWGLFEKEADLIDEIAESAMQDREKSQLRI